MRPRFLGWISLMLLAGVTSGGPTPAPTPTPGPLSVAPSSLTFNSIGLAQPVIVTDPRFTGTYTISGCAGVATFGPVTNGTLSVTSAAAGSCTLTVSDTFLHSAPIAITVTSLSVPVQ